jgi:hypothetical protein
MLLSLLGFGAGVALWQSGQPILGVIVAFLFGGGLGWKALAWLPSAFQLPAVRKHGDDFLHAWEGRFGPMVRGVESTYPPPGLFKEYAKLHKKFGTSADEVLDAVYGQRVSPTGDVLTLIPMLETVSGGGDFILAYENGEEGPRLIAQHPRGGGHRLSLGSLQHWRDADYRGEPALSLSFQGLLYMAFLRSPDLDLWRTLLQEKAPQAERR